MRWTSLQKLSITSGAALVLLGLSGGVSYYYASQLMAADSAVRQTNENITTAFQIVVSTQDAERATKAYVVRGESSARTSLQQAQSSVEDAVDAMNQQSEDNPRQRHLLERLLPQVAASFSEFRTTLAIRDHAGADSARRYLMRESLPHEADSLRKIVVEMRNEELRVLAERTRHRNATGATALRIILLGTALTFLLAGLALQPMRADVHARLTSSIWHSRAGATANDGAADGTGAEERLKALQWAVAALAAAPDSTGGARALVDAGAGAFAAALGATIVPNGAGGFSVLHASLPALDRVSPDLARVVADALRTGAPVVAPSRAERERQCGTLAVLDSLDATGALLVVPLRRGTIVSGVLLLAFAGDHEFGTDELDFAETLGLLGGPAVASRPPTS
jgi:CHASE3 domain sensor protein